MRGRGILRVPVWLLSRLDNLMLYFILLFFFVGGGWLTGTCSLVLALDQLKGCLD